MAGNWAMEQSYPKGGIAASAKRECEPDYGDMAEKLTSRERATTDLCDAIENYLNIAQPYGQRAENLKELFGHLYLESKDMSAEAAKLIELAEKQQKKD